MDLRPHGPQPCASAYSATPTCGNAIRGCEWMRSAAKVYPTHLARVAAFRREQTPRRGLAAGPGRAAPRHLAQPLPFDLREFPARRQLRECRVDLLRQRFVVIAQREDEAFAGADHRPHAERSGRPFLREPCEHELVDGCVDVTASERC